ncbi:MAG: hypothetical protein V1709_03120 [Planctomycetota bacterium]
MHKSYQPISKLARKISKRIKQIELIKQIKISARRPAPLIPTDFVGITGCETNKTCYCLPIRQTD